MSAKTKDKDVKLNRPKCYIVGGGFDYIRLMFQLGCDGATNVSDADFVLFTGGEDVSPDLYNEVPMAKTNYNRARDDFEGVIYNAALERELPMVGICRGGQFLNVKNGGRMWQHVTCHAGEHLARIEVPPFVKNRRRTIMVTSTHHQMMIPTEDAIILATANVALEKDSPGLTKIGKGGDADPDIEVVLYQDTSCLCFQPHPEFKNCPADCVDFFEECLDNWIYPKIPDKMTKAIHAQASDVRVC